MAETREQPNLNNYKIPGARGPRNRNAVEKASDRKGTLRKLIRYFSTEKKRIAVLLACVVATVITSVYAPRLQSQAIDSITERRYGDLNFYLTLMLAFYGFQSLLTLFQGRFSALLSQSIVKRMRNDLFDKIVNLPIRYLDSHPHGDIMSRMTNDIENVSATISQSLSSLVSGFLTILGTVAMMLYLCPSLAFLSCATVILTVTATKFLSTAMRRFYRRRQVLLGSLNSTVEEMVTGYKTVVAYSREDAVLEDFSKTSDELTKVGIMAEILGGSMGPVMNVINNISFVIIAAFGGYFAINGTITIGVISAFIIYAKQFGRPIDELAQIYGQIQTAIAGAERVFAIMEQPSEDKSGERSMDSSKGVITFRNVNFSYVEGKRVLKDFDLQVSAGQKVALVGSTGSGKTTVVNLLMRFYDVDSGEILIDGVNIRNIDCDNLRRNTAIVLQDTVLFADTIERNLKYANDHITDKEMEQAARLCHCHNMIAGMPEGYQTLLSQSGHNLSQGQRQLLSIARAFLAKPKILILDEATSSVDTRTEKHIQDAMVRLMENRTSLIIAHRLSTIQDADRIVVMDQGRIVETGNHEQLLEQKGRYYELYMTQFAGQAT
ncbi:MAG: ABC transporter ATP-binding protein/permease [Lachnospiraceae bacterium]|nr:ABC transporter ATP-binding protein/permease [Butyrivibrio sp.]MCM1344405.1 ABC transporter ATP-binding protein/permease [Muribaculaceae bacterium]MCM1411683.1 ABC transporter ATP-binding protein/permease [Lachnospiraceae bacterium]